MRIVQLWSLETMLHRILQKVMQHGLHQHILLEAISRLLEGHLLDEVFDLSTFESERIQLKI